LHENKSLPQINETFGGLDRHIRSRIFLRDASGNASTRTLNKSERGRATANNPRHTKSSSLYLEESPTSVRDLLSRISHLKVSETISHEDLNRQFGLGTRERKPSRSESQLSPMTSTRKPSSPLRQFSDYHTNYSSAVSPIKERGEITTAPVGKERKEYYLTAHHRVLERAKRRIRPRVYVEGHKKNNSFSNGLYIRTPLDI